MIPRCDILIGDVRAMLRDLPDESVNCVVTSPPYWGLRNYGTEPQVWGGVVGCGHEWTKERSRNEHCDRSIKGKDEHGNGAFGTERGTQGSKFARGNAIQHGHTCAKCGAWLGELGLEPDPVMFVQHIVAVFNEVHRVLAKDGTLWLNFGDSYIGSPGNARGGNEALGLQIGAAPHRSASNKRGDGLKRKDLVGMPWRVAFGLQAQGWYLRQDIIWHKRSPMPESVKDRCTKAHEYIFFLSKSPRYFYDAAAISEPVTGGAHPRGKGVNPKAVGGWQDGPGTHQAVDFARPSATETKFDKDSQWRNKQNSSFAAAVVGLVHRRNARSVWTIASEPYPEAHYATFPTSIPRRCILAGSRFGDTVLDPFGGSGTTGFVANQCGRNAVLIDINPANEALMRDRLAPIGSQGVMNLATA